jgi:hypothetical protein
MKTMKDLNSSLAASRRGGGLKMMMMKNSNNNMESSLLQGFLTQLLSETKAVSTSETRPTDRLQIVQDDCDSDDDADYDDDDDDDDDDVVPVHPKRQQQHQQQEPVIIICDNARVSKDSFDRYLDRQRVRRPSAQRQHGQRRFSDGGVTALSRSCQLISPPTKENKRDTRWWTDIMTGNGHSTTQNSDAGLVRPRRRCSEDFTCTSSSLDCLDVSNDTVGCDGSDFLTNSSHLVAPESRVLVRHNSDEYLKKAEHTIDHAVVESSPMTMISSAPLSPSSISRFSSTSLTKKSTSLPASPSSSQPSKSTDVNNKRIRHCDFSLPPLPVRGEMKIIHVPVRQYREASA